MNFGIEVNKNRVVTSTEVDHVAMSHVFLLARFNSVVIQENPVFAGFFVAYNYMATRYTDCELEVAVGVVIRVKFDVSILKAVVTGTMLPKLFRVVIFPVKIAIVFFKICHTKRNQSYCRNGATRRQYFTWST